MLQDYETPSMQVNKNNGRCQADALNACASTHFSKKMVYKNMTLSPESLNF